MDAHVTSRNHLRLGPTPTSGLSRGARVSGAGAGQSDGVALSRALAHEPHAATRSMDHGRAHVVRGPWTQAQAQAQLLCCVTVCVWGVRRAAPQVHQLHCDARPPPSPSDETQPPPSVRMLPLVFASTATVASRPLDSISAPRHRSPDGHHRHTPHARAEFTCGCAF